MNEPLVILTRAESDNQRVAPFFQEQGLQVLSVPLLEIRDLQIDPWEIPDDFGPYLVLITSSRSTTRWLALRPTLANRDLRGCLVVGRQSALRLYEIDPDTPILVIGHSVEELLEDIVNLRRPFPHIVGEVAPEAAGLLRAGSDINTILYPCSARRREEGVTGLQRLGFRVIELPLYEPVLPAENSALLINVLSNLYRPTALAFFSPSAVENFFHILSVESEEESPPFMLSDHLHFAAIGDTTAEAIYKYGIEDVIISDLPEAEMLARKVAQEMERIKSLGN